MHDEKIRVRVTATGQMLDLVVFSKRPEVITVVGAVALEVLRPAPLSDRASCGRLLRCHDAGKYNAVPGNVKGYFPSMASLGVAIACGVTFRIWT